MADLLRNTHNLEESAAHLPSLTLIFYATSVKDVHHDVIDIELGHSIPMALAINVSHRDEFTKRGFKIIVY